MNTFDQLLISNGIADTRVFSIGVAMNSMHTAIAQLDNYNLAQFKKLFPGVAEAVNKFAETKPGLKKDF